ncbi:MAG: heparinase II/III domain-containing protein [Planctomycetota bacterium]
MSLYLSEDEREWVEANKHEPPLNTFLWALDNRCRKRSEDVGLLNHGTTVRWWHCYAEYVTDAAMMHALKPNDQLSAWLHEVVLGAVRRPIDDWIGPWFRDHTDPPTGELETAHLSWATAAALDLCPEIFDEQERREIRDVLARRSIPMCRRWLDANTILFNHRHILLAGLTAVATLLDDEEQLNYCARQLTHSVEAFQPDGSYGESLQYSNYAMYALMIGFESLMRHQSDLIGQLPIERYARGMRWHAASLFYMKPLAGWGPSPRPRAANFNDSGAMFAPSTDVLLHIAARCRDTLPREAGLARWIQQTYCPPVPEMNSGNSSTFGFINKFGFLSIPLLSWAADAIPPSEAGLTELEAFSNGDVLVRDERMAQTILAIHGGGDKLYAVGHLHADLNSFILAHDNERLLVDPGHSCYRNMTHKLEVSTECHNAVTFEVESEHNGDKTKRLQQTTGTAKRRLKDNGEPYEPVNRGGRRSFPIRVKKFGSLAPRPVHCTVNRLRNGAGSGSCAALMLSLSSTKSIPPNPYEQRGTGF